MQTFDLTEAEILHPSLIFFFLSSQSLKTSDHFKCVMTPVNFSQGTVFVLKFSVVVGYDIVLSSYSDSVLCAHIPHLSCCREGAKALEHVKTISRTFDCSSGECREKKHHPLLMWSCFLGQ